MEVINMNKILRAKLLRLYEDEDMTTDEIQNCKDAIQPYMVNQLAGNKGGLNFPRV